jgi:Zn-dependent protease
VFLAEPARTPYDLNFDIAGFPVRVSAWFWAGAAFLGMSALQEDMARFFLWVVTLFISILIHELGHAFAFRYYGQEAHVVLYHFGGLAVPERDSWSGYGGKSFGRADRLQSQLVISFAGPAAGFLLAGIVLAAVWASGGEVHLNPRGFPFSFIRVILPAETADHLRQFVGLMLYVNIYWGLVNLLPVLPLDGGQMARSIFLMQDPWGGMVKTLWLSTITGAAIAVLSLTMHDSIFVALMFGSLAASSYMALQQTTGGRPW